MNRLAILLLAIVSVASAEELRLTASEWPPYVAADNYRNGVVMLLTETALSRSGYTVTTTLADWPAALESTIAGQQDLIAGVWKTAEREADLLFSDPLLTNYIVFTKRQNNDTNYTSRGDIEGLRIGVVADYAYGEQPYDTAGLTVISSGSVSTNMRKLMANELDLVLADGRVAAYAIDKLVAAKELSFIRNPLETRSLHVAVSRRRADAEAIIAAINDNLQAMRTDGSYNEILATFRISE